MLVAILTVLALMQLDPNAPNGIVSMESSYVAGERLDFSISSRTITSLFPATAA